MTCRLCPKPVHARGLCQTHYSNLSRYGDPNGNPLRGKADPPPEYAGRGVLRCLICERPYVDHEIGPCPVAKAQLLR